MKRSLVNQLVCPACQGAVTVEAIQQSTSDEDIVEGTLTCCQCAAAYPIRTGVPRLLMTDLRKIAASTGRTQQTYNFTWRRFGKREIEEGWEKDSYHYNGLIPPSLFGGKGSRGLDAGCGGGADLLWMAACGAELIGVDLSAGVETAAQVTRHLPNVHVVQADVNSLPFHPGTFDFIYSFGVLHHLPNPAVGFARLASLLKPGAPLITYLYEDFSDRSVSERFLLRVVRGLRAVTSRLPASWLYALCWMAVPAVWLCCSVPAHALRRFPGIASHIPFRHTLRWPVLASDLFDRFAPPIEWRYNPETITCLYHNAGFGAVQIRRFRGWVSWGFKCGLANGRADGEAAAVPATVVTYHSAQSSPL